MVALRTRVLLTALSAATACVDDAAAFAQFCRTASERCTGQDGGSGGGGAFGGGGGTFGGGGGGTFGGGGGSSTASTFASVGITGANVGMGNVAAISGSPGDVWAVTQGGVVLHSSGAEFVQTAQVSVGAFGIFAAQGQVFVGTNYGWNHCLVDCAVATGSRFTYISSGSGESGRALCGRSVTQVYAIAESSSATSLLRWSGTGWTQLASLPIDNVDGCVVDAAGVLWVAGDNGVVRYANGAGAFERLVPANQTWHARAVASLGTEVHVVGDNHRIARRTGPNVWSTVNAPAGVTQPLFAVAGTSASTVWAGGQGSVGGSNGAPVKNWYAWNGSTWSNASADLDGMDDVFAIFVADDTTVYFGGGIGNGAQTPVVVRATR